MRIGLLQTGNIVPELAEQYGSYAEMFIRLFQLAGADFEFQTYNVYQNQLPDSVQDCEGWLITGSRFGVYEDHEWISPLMTLTKKIVQAKCPLMGVCFGHQLVAQALGGRVEKSTNGWGLGLDTYNLSNSPPLAIKGRKSVCLNIFHQDQVVALPPAATAYAQSAFCQYAGFYLGDKVLTVQAHPEFVPGYSNDLLQVYKQSKIPTALAEPAIAQLSKPEARIAEADSLLFGQWMAKFFTGQQHV